MVMDKLLKVKEAVVRHPIFVIGSAVWMLADMALDIVSVLGYHALSEEVWWIIKVNLFIQNVIASNLYLAVGSWDHSWGYRLGAEHVM